MKRRDLLKTSAALAVATAAHAEKLTTPIIDTNVYLGDWPFRDLPSDGADKLDAKLRQRDVAEAWAGSFDALLHPDLDAVNARLFESCQGTLFRPIGAIDPKQSGWRETLRRIHESHAMSGVRLHPNYHDYKLDDPSFRELLGLARDRGLLVQIVFRMDDSRTLHPRLAVPDVDGSPLGDSITSAKGVRIQLLNALRTFRDALTLERLGKLGAHFELAMLERIEGIRHHLDRAPNAKLAFGSYAPFYYFDSAELKLRESELTPDETKLVSHANAQQLLTGV